MSSSATQPCSCAFTLLLLYIFFKKNTAYLFLKLNSWPRTTRFSFTIYPITFPSENGKEWKKLFKPCASQRLFLPVGLQSTSSQRSIKWLLWMRLFCGLCSSWSWMMWILCSTWTRTSYSCSQSRRSGRCFLVLIRATWLPWRQSTRSRALAGTTALPVTLIMAKLESTQGSCSWTWHASGKNFSRYFLSHCLSLSWWYF